MGVFKKERLQQIGADDHAPRHTILVVDDEDGNLRAMRAMLDPMFRVLEANDGRQALELLDKLEPAQAPSVILSDQRMPRMTGVELFERVRERLPDTIRIIITGFVDVNAVVDSINRAGIYKFVVKPFDREDLLLTVQRAIEAFELRRQIEAHVAQLEQKVRERTRELEAKNQALVEAYAQIEQASLTDPLTGLGNRRFLARRMQSDGPRRRLAFVLIDLDHFKAVNDRYGHAAGDALLGEFAQILREHCREGDTATRWGGEEFLLTIAVDDEDAALRCSERLRAAVEAHEFDLGGGTRLARTCSIGFACLPFEGAAGAGLAWERVVDIADAALYQAKRGGRNAVVGYACAGRLPDDCRERLADPEALCSAGLLRVLRGATRQDPTPQFA
jgi:diguanylate cyclase (GGDEF)-like protein